LNVKPGVTSPRQSQRTILCASLDAWIAAFEVEQSAGEIEPA
jgi:hypothetical protein